MSIFRTTEEKNKAAFQKANDLLKRNGVIADLDALKKATPSFNYTVKQNGALAEVATNIPARVTRVEGGGLGTPIGIFTEDTVVKITSDKKGAVNVSGDANDLDLTAPDESFNLGASQMKKGGNEKVTEFVTGKVQSAKLVR